MQINYRKTDFVANRFKNLSRQIQDAIESRMLDATLEIQSDTLEDSGNAKQSWDVSVDKQGKDIVATITNDAATEDGKPYALYAVEGRPPGKFPPYGANSHLARWAKVRGMNPYLVARKIAREGTERHKESPIHFDSEGNPVSEGAIGKAIELIRLDIRRIKEKRS